MDNPFGENKGTFEQEWSLRVEVDVKVKNGLHELVE